MKEINTIKEFIKFIGENRIKLRTYENGEYACFDKESLRKTEEKYGVKIKGLINSELKDTIKW